MSNYSQLKQDNLPLLSQRKGTDTDIELSQDDMDQLDKAKWNMLKYPAISCGATYLLTLGIKYITKPGVFENPLYPDERSYLRRKYFKQAFSKQMVFFAFIGGFTLGFGKYEFAKYYLFLKHRNLVNAYLDAVERSYLDNLQNMGQNMEVKIQEDIHKVHGKQVQEIENIKNNN